MYWLIIISNLAKLSQINSIKTNIEQYKREQSYIKQHIKQSSNQFSSKSNKRGAYNTKYIKYKNKYIALKKY